MSKKESNKESKINLWSKIAGYLVIFLLFMTFIIDRSLHILLPHREHQQFTVWAKDMTNVKYAFSRLFIFSLPIIIYNIIF